MNPSRPESNGRLAPSGSSSRRDRELAEPVRLSHRSPVHVLARVEPLHLAGDVHRALRDIDALDPGDARVASADVPPALVHRQPERRHRPEARHHYAAAAAAIHTHIPSPPSTASTCPVMNAPASDTRNLTAAATSRGVPSRPSGVAFRIASRAGSGSASVSSVE